MADPADPAACTCAALIRDWQTVAILAIQHRVAPLLYRRLTADHLPASLPPEVADWLQQTYVATMADNVRLFHWLRIALKALNTVGIPTIVLKGAHLAALIYGNRGLRPMGDLDVLVHPADLARLEAALAPVAIRPVVGQDRLGANDRHANYTTPRDIRFEFHVDLLNPAWPVGFDLEQLWSAARPVEIDGVGTRVLAPEHLLLHLCAHMFAHGSVGDLRSLCDIDATVRCYDIALDWSEVERLSCGWGMERITYLAFRLAHDLLAVPIPPGLLERLLPADLPDAAYEIVVGGLAEPDSETELPTFTQLWSEHSLRRRLTTLAQEVIAPPDKLARIYQVPADSPRIWLYYPVRWITRLIQVLPLVWAMLRRDPGVRRQVERQNRWMALRDYLFRLA